MGASAQGELGYPVPWAATAKLTSFVETPETYRGGALPRRRPGSFTVAADLAPRDMALDFFRRMRREPPRAARRRSASTS